MNQTVTRSRLTRKEDPPGATVIVGLGNPILTDDAVGLVVARRVHELLDLPAVELCELAAGGVELMETLFGYRRAVVIDAIVTEGGKPGTCYSVDLARPWSSQRTGMSHEIGLLEGLDLGRRLGLAVPEHVHLYAVEVSDPFTFGTRMTREVEDAVFRVAGEITAEILADLDGGGLPSVSTAPIESEQP